MKYVYILEAIVEYEGSDIVGVYLIKEDAEARKLKIENARDRYWKLPEEKQILAKWPQYVGADLIVTKHRIQ